MADLARLFPGDAPLGERPLLRRAAAAELSGLFKVLADPTRIRLLHALTKAGELRVTDLCRQLGMKPQAVSNQLRRLADARILAARREGSSVLYRIADPCVARLLDHGLCLIEDIR